MLRNLGEPSHLIILAILLIVIFGYKRLPDAARGIGRSMRVFKSEMEDMKKDGKDPDTDQPVQQGQAPVQQPQYPQQSAQQPRYQQPPAQQSPVQQPQAQHAPVQHPPIPQPQYTPDGTQPTYQAPAAGAYVDSPIDEDAPRTDNQPGPVA